jgi:hypothetical protein
MVKAIVDIDEETNKVLNHLKVEYGLKDKSQAINVIAREFKRVVRVEPEVRPEYVEKLKRLQRGKHVTIGSIGNFKKRYGLE